MNDNSNNRRQDNRHDDELMPDSLESAETSPREKPSQEDRIWTPFDLPLDSFKRREEARPAPVEQTAAPQELEPVQEPVAPRVPEQFKERDADTARPVREAADRAAEDRVAADRDVTDRATEDRDTARATGGRPAADETRSPQTRATEDRTWEPPPTIGRPTTDQPWHVPEQVLAQPSRPVKEPSEVDARETMGDEAHVEQRPSEYRGSAERETAEVPAPVDGDVQPSTDVPETEERVPGLLDEEALPLAQDKGKLETSAPTQDLDEVDVPSEAEEYSFPTAPLPDEVQEAVRQAERAAAPAEAADQTHDVSLDAEPSFRPAEVSSIPSKGGLAEDLSEAIDSEQADQTRVEQARAEQIRAEQARAEQTREDLRADDIDLLRALEAEATGEVEAWQAPPKDDPDYDELEGVPEHLRPPSDAERLRKRLDKYPESRGDKKQSFKLNLNRASHRQGLVAVAVLGALLIVGIFGLANRVQRERANFQAQVERQITTMKISEGNIPSEQRVQHSDGKRIINASIPLFGDPQIDQYTQAWAKNKIDEFEIQTSVLPASTPDRRPILALSHRSYLVEGELASIQLVAETYKNAKDLAESRLQNVESEDILYDISYRTFLNATDIFREGAPTTLAAHGTRKIQTGEYRVPATLAAPAYERQIEADKAQQEAPANAPEGETPQDDAVEGDVPQAGFGVKTLLAEEDVPANVAADENEAGENTPAENDAVEDNEAGNEPATSEIPRETVTTTTEEEKEPDTTYAAVILPETTILYKHLRFRPNGLELQLDPALVPAGSPTVSLHYDYEEILDVLRFDMRTDGTYQLNLRIDPLGDTQRQYTSHLLQTLYGTTLEERALPTTSEVVTEEPTDESPDADPVENEDEADTADTGDNNAENNAANSSDTNTPALFGAKVLSAEDAALVETEGTEGAGDVATTETTTDSTRRAVGEPTISNALNQAGLFPQGGLQLTDHFSNTKARYNQEIRYVALTFNNAPSSQTSQTLLDLLESYRGHGTFFVRGSTAAEEAAGPLMQAIVEQGSELGNNAYNFYSFAVLTDAQIQAEINETSNLIEEKAGVRPRFTRPPYGDYDERILVAGGVPMVNWSFTSGDDWGATTDVIYETILEYIEPGSIILSMDGNEDTIQAMQRALPELYGRGYRFVTLSDLFEIYSEEGVQDGVLYSSVWS